MFLPWLAVLTPPAPCRTRHALQAATTSASSEQGSAAQLAAEKAAAMAAAERGAAEVTRLRGELAQLQRMMERDDAMAGAGVGCRTSMADISDVQVGAGRCWVGLARSGWRRLPCMRKLLRVPCLAAVCKPQVPPAQLQCTPRSPMLSVTIPHAFLYPLGKSTPRQIMEVKEQAERKIAQLHTRIQQLESQANRMAGENASLADRLAEAQGAVAAAAQAVDAADAAGSCGAAELAAARRARQEVEARCAQLEGELRKSKRREEKLQVRAAAAGDGVHL